ncbi:alkaline phosphatase D family protein [Aliifodinibius sp. S!AR15-10]|uniref:alkaline phosphatase D family protein n=1 Tax=Aliifodinibius sp. S!AR15-10 TaxID=2950437 RepID=UPI00285EB352|nr:alkaline phosphatase D family protein [Aliifodinibius sp. S!AR15-10]MDR8390277.1 alkaline phosphatase D family protein [Aliifodinibius sp. S!AR15-10]
MDRKESIKTMLLGTVSLPLLKKSESLSVSKPGQGATAAEPMNSEWDRWPDMEWTGPMFWGNRLQDWHIRDGKAECAVSDNNRTLHCLTHQLAPLNGTFSTQVEIEVLNLTESPEDYVGFRIGAKGNFEDYRSAAVFGEGLEAGITVEGNLFVGDQLSAKSIPLDNPIRLVVEGIRAKGGGTLISISAVDPASGKTLSAFKSDGPKQSQLAGNVALVSHFQSEDRDGESPSVAFSAWKITGDKVRVHPQQTYGPICFAQYTLDSGILKMTAQLAPIEKIEGHRVALQIRENNRWSLVQETTVDSMSRTAHFRVENWEYGEKIPYRITILLPLNTGEEEFHYEGTIAANPTDSDKLKTAVFSCNSHYGFPNNEVVEHVGKYQPDMAVFLGDQIYESHGGFGVQRSPVEKASLDFLRKWYMFGWSYRDIFRHIPSAFIPDDHDVYHGNIWGEGGGDAPVEKGWGYDSQDEGGYKMPPEWVNMVQRCLTSNLPEPYDPTPVKQDISVYYTGWKYGGISFAIIEDRKFKTAPKNVLPEEAKVVNGFIQNREFEIRDYYDIDADLLGERQISFLRDWAADWSNGTEMKAVLSQTNFCTLATLPEGSVLDQVVPKLEIPERGKYVKGDAPTTDMDSNGWPQKGRDEALKTIRKGFAFHIAGDQHLASTVHYGIEEFGDAGFGFAGPALNNVWPRRWWPPVGKGHRPLPGRPKNTGNFEDGFGNKMTVYAVGNPVQTNREPAIIYDRATGYGIVTFDKSERTITVECWPRYVDPEANPGGQFDGWPVVIRQEDNYGREAVAYLPEIIVEGIENPVVEVYNQATGELEYALRIKGRTFRPKVFEVESHRLRIGEPDTDEWQEFDSVSPADEGPIVCKF